MNSTNTTVDALTAEIIQEAYENYVYSLILFSATASSVYTTLIGFSQEREHIWSKSFSLPTLLYIFARYGNLLGQGLILVSGFLPSGRPCNILAKVFDILTLFTYIGVQGLLGLRAYSICEGNKILSSALAFGFFSYLGLDLYSIAAFPGCSSDSSFSRREDIINTTVDIVTVCTDLLIFGICMWKVWGIWRLKCNNRIQIKSLIFTLFMQSIFRCCFVLTISFVDVILTQVQGFFIAECYTRIQNVMSATLVADFTLDLRRFNSTKIEASQMSLPSLRFSNVLQHVHQSFLVEMATPEERNMEDSENIFDGDNDPNDLPLNMDVVQPTEA